MSMDIKPKHLIKIIFPLIAVIFLSLIYVGYTDLKSSKEDAYEQARTNIKVAREYLELHFNAAENQLFLLNELLNKRFLIDDFLASAQHVVDQQPKFSEIGLYTGGNYYATNGVTVTEATERVKTRPWFQVSREAGETYLSPIYMSRSTKKWSVTLVKVARSYEGRLVHVLLEMDATGLYQQLSLLKTLEHGYLYAVDLSNRQVVMHPDERRIATPSVSVSPELIEKIRAGQLKGTIDNYMYQMQWKFSVYDADNPFGWVLLSGTIKQDITAKAFNLGAVGLALVAIIAIMVIVRFTSMLIHNNGRNLIEVNELSEFNQQLTKMIHGLLPCNQVMLFVYDEVANEFVDVTRNHHFSYVDVASYLPVTKHRSMRVNKHDPYDVIARTIAPHQNVIRVPLTKQQHVQGIIYILGATAKTPWVVNIYRNYAQGALNHVLLRQQIQNKDQMTGLMNKNYLRIQLQQTLQCERENYYLAMMDIDDFKMINDGLGHLFGDEVIMTVAEKLKRFLPQNSTAARYGGDEFSIMFQADSFADAKAKLQVLRDRISLHRVSYENKECQFTMSIGCAPVTGDLDSVISAADTALYEAKGKKRPKVCKHDMLDGPCQFYEPKDGSDPQMLCTGKNSIVA